jgi:hypothetical protein
MGKKKRIRIMLQVIESLKMDWNLEPAKKLSLSLSLSHTHTHRELMMGSTGK